MQTLYTVNYKTLWKKWKETQINGKASHAHGLKNLVLLTCLYYLKWFTDSMWSVSKFQWHYL